MAFRFWRRVQLFPGVSLNLSKSGASLSMGPRGAQYTIGPCGTRATVGLPGTVLFYSVQNPGRASRRSRGSRPPPEPLAPLPIPVKDRLSLGFFQRLVTPAAERAFVDGLRALHKGDEIEALAQLVTAPVQADAAWTAGLLRLKRHDLEAAHALLHSALQRQSALGQLNATTSFSVTPEITAHIGPRERGTRLALAELHQRRDQHALAAEHLRLILTETPDDVVVKAALAELLLGGRPNSRVTSRHFSRCKQR